MLLQTTIKPQLRANAPIAVVLFSGGGGIEAGMVEAGIRPLGVEFDPTNSVLSGRMANMYDRNFQEYGHKVIRKSVQELQSSGFLGLPRYVDFLHASPVCSNFSKMRTVRQESSLDIEMALSVKSALAHFQPRVFTLEQVPKYEESESWKAIALQLEELGYFVTKEVINFADYGVPQKERKRLIVIACKEKMIPMPKPTSKVCWWDVVSDLVPDLPPSTLVAPQQEALFEYLDKNEPCPLLIPRIGYRDKCRVQPFYEQAKTLLKSIFTDGKGNNRSRFLDLWLPSGQVKQLTIRAAARIQTFPDWYEFDESVATSGSAIGLSVPPLFSKILFEHIQSVENSNMVDDIDLAELAASLSDGESPRFKYALLNYLYESYGIRKSVEIPDVECFVNATARTYTYRGVSEINNICGAIQLSPGRVGGKKIKKTVTKMPESINSLDFSKCRLLYDSLAFTDVLTADRRTPEEALERQLSTLKKIPKPEETWIVSYDRLIDEKLIDGNRKKQRWTVEEGIIAVRETVEAAKYLSSQRHRLEHRLVMSCQGVDANQYTACVKQVLEHCESTDIIGLGGWCILGRQPSYLKAFWSTINSVVPLISKCGIKNIHIFGVTWYKPKPGFPLPPLGPLLWLCDRYGISLSTDSTSPIGNALWKDIKRSGASHPYWRNNLAYVKAKLATLRDSPTYQAPPGYNNKA